MKIVHRALDAGINFIDTADVYSHGESETIVGKALASVDRDKVVLATKVHGAMGDDPNQQGNSRRWIMTEVENSLRRLGVDYIDLYQMHRPDPDVEIEETLGALTDLQHAGKIRAFGTSTFPAYQIVQAQWAAERHGLSRFLTEQPPYSILVRGIEADVLPVAQEYGMGVLPWSPLAGGWLSGRYGTGKENTSNRAKAGQFSSRYDVTLPANQRKIEVVDQLQNLADKAGLTLVELAVSFVINHPAITSAIIGPRTMEQLETQLGVPDVKLSEETLDAIDALVPPGTNLVPGEMGYTPPALSRAALRRR
ncbi:MAG: aldo/keto reductase [Acidimicrobiaceae bacterium]|nr:aldo/keto reductase [Acidimicrobiaceae bacterium]